MSRRRRNIIRHRAAGPHWRAKLCHLLCTYPLRMQVLHANNRGFLILHWRLQTGFPKFATPLKRNLCFSRKSLQNPSAQSHAHPRSPQGWGDPKSTGGALGRLNGLPETFFWQKKELNFQAFPRNFKKMQTIQEICKNLKK